MRVLGIDPGLVGTGYGLIEPRPERVAVIDSGVIETRAELPLEVRVHAIYDAVGALLDAHGPAVLALEDLYTEYRFPRTALLMAHARGVICLAARQRDVTVMTLPAAVVKRAVSGNGAASKEQVQHCVQALLKLAALPRPSHVADALALAFTALSRVGGGLDGPLRDLPQDRRRGRSPRSNGRLPGLASQLRSRGTPPTALPAASPEQVSGGRRQGRRRNGRGGA